MPAEQFQQHINEFYVYVHTRLDTGNPFYVGKGRGKRHFSKNGRSQLWARIANKHGFSSSIVKSGLGEKDAFAEEIALISEIRSLGHVLANMTDGGEGPSGRIFTDETKDKMRAAKLGKKHSHGKKIGDALRGRKRPDVLRAKLRGQTRSSETRKKISDAKTGTKLGFSHNAAFQDGRAEYRITDNHRSRLSDRFAGQGNNHHNADIVSFIHPVHGERRCTQFELRSEFGLKHPNLSKVVSGSRKSTGGWMLSKGISL